MVDEKILAQQVVATEAHTQALKGHSEEVKRLSGLVASLIVVLRRADAQTANGRLQLQAALNQIVSGQNQLLSILMSPEALAGVTTAEMLDEARQIKRKTIKAITGRDRAENRQRDDEITLVRIPLLAPGSKRRSLRVNRRLAKVIFTLLGGLVSLFLYWLARKIGVPLPRLE